MFDYLKPYVIGREFENSDEKHVFYKVDREDIKNAEKRMLIEFPKELKLFFEEIGYGFFYDKDECFTDVIMKPQDIADYRCGEGNYYYAEERDFLKEEDLVFFEVDSNCHIHIKLSGENIGKIYFGNRLIADSLEMFIQVLSENSNFFLNI